jgi:hypothetical protein
MRKCHAIHICYTKIGLTKIENSLTFVGTFLNS